MIVKSLIAKLQNRYHVSAAEIEDQDVHQMIVIGVAAIVPHNAMAVAPLRCEPKGDPVITMFLMEGGIETCRES